MAAPQLLRPFIRSFTLVLAAAITACGSEPTAPSIIDAEFHPSLEVDLSASVRTASGLYYRDIEVGTGAVAARGDSVTVQYELFGTNGVRRQAGPFSFRLGVGDAIPGFDEGVTGMRVGGRRQLILPPHLAYGTEILVFNVELILIR